jgi:hypothetical protein
MLVVRLLLITMLATSTCACSHLIETDYPQYLSNNAGSANLPATNSAREYSLTIDTQHHHDEFRAFTTGAAHLWIIEFGKMLDDTLQSAEVQTAFGTLKKTTSSDTGSDILIFDLIEYSFEESGARISMDISMFSGGKEIFTKNYIEDGRTEGSRIFWGGASAQKNAVQQATKSAMDEILRDLITDMNAENKRLLSGVMADR